MVMPWSFGLVCWLTGRNKVDILGPGAGGTAFLNPDAFCSRPASFAAEWLLRSCPCTLPSCPAMRQCPDGQQRARLFPDASLHCWARFLQSRRPVGVGKRPAQGCGRPTGIPPRPRLRPAAWHGQLQGPHLRRVRGRRACARQGRLSRWSRSCLAARPPLRPIQVSPSARLPAGREPRASAAPGHSVPGPAGSRACRGSRGALRGVLAAAAPGNLPQRWEGASERGSPRLPLQSLGWRWRGWVWQASLSPVGRPGGSPGCFQG